MPSAGPGPGLAYTTQLSWPQPQQQRHLVAGGSTPSAAAAVTSALCLLWCSHRPLRDTVTYSGLVWWKCVNVSVTKHLDTIQLESVEHFEFLDFSTDVMSSYFLCLSNIYHNTFQHSLGQWESFKTSELCYKCVTSTCSEKQMNTTSWLWGYIKTLDNAVIRLSR